MGSPIHPRDQGSFENVVHPGKNPPKKAKMTESVGKVMATVFLGSEKGVSDRINVKRNYHQ